MSGKATVKHPAKVNEWRDRFRSYSMRVSFQIGLTRPMLEFLCAVSDDVAWDRTLFRGLYQPDNWKASECSLIKRGLVQRKSEEELLAMRDEDRPSAYFQCCKLTPAGRLLVELLKTCGMFVEADAAISKRA